MYLAWGKEQILNSSHVKNIFVDYKFKIFGMSSLQSLMSSSLENMRKELGTTLIVPVIKKLSPPGSHGFTYHFSRDSRADRTCRVLHLLGLTASFFCAVLCILHL